MTNRLYKPFGIGRITEPPLNFEEVHLRSMLCCGCDFLPRTDTPSMNALLKELKFMKLTRRMKGLRKYIRIAFRVTSDSVSSESQ